MDGPEFIAMVAREKHTYGPTHDTDAFILSGEAHVGENCYITTEYGPLESTIISIKTYSGYVLDATWNSPCIMTLRNLSDGITIPYAGIISDRKLLPGDVANMPLKLFVDDVYNANTDFMKGIVVVGKIMQGTIRMWDKVKIGNEHSSISAIVGGIERFTKLLEESHYGQSVGILLYRAPENVLDIIEKGMWMEADDCL